MNYYDAHHTLNRHQRAAVVSRPTAWNPYPIEPDDDSNLTHSYYRNGRSPERGRRPPKPAFAVRNLSCLSRPNRLRMPDYFRNYLRHLTQYGSLSGPGSPVPNGRGGELIDPGGGRMLAGAPPNTTFAQSVENLRADLTTGQLAEEFAGLWRQSSQGSTRAALDRTNEQLNRYWNVLPYDSNRVRLRPPQPVVVARCGELDAADRGATVLLSAGEHGQAAAALTTAKTDYVNASWVTVHVPELDLETVYIAAQVGWVQGPKDETIDHFWHMICQHNVGLVLMLTDVVESGVNKCAQYWPELNQSMEISAGTRVLSCTHVERNNKAGWTIRDLFVADLHHQKEWSVVQIQMHGWPDHGAPKEARRLLDFWRCAKARAPPRRQPPSLVGSTDCAPNAGGFVPSAQTPTLVHCSAGVGRTGAYVLLETLISLVDAESPLRPVDIVADLRRQRMAMVQTEEQLAVACAAALLYYDQGKAAANGRRLLG